MEPVASLHGETEGKREGDVFKTRMNRCTFTVRPFQQRAVSPKGLGRETSNFAILLLKVFFCLGWSVGSGVGGVCSTLAAEAIWVSSTSKVGQLVPVPLLMC